MMPNTPARCETARPARLASSSSLSVAGLAGAYEFGVCWCYKNRARPHLLVSCKCCDTHPLGFERCEMPPKTKEKQEATLGWCDCCKLRVDRVGRLRG